VNVATSINNLLSMFVHVAEQLGSFGWPGSEFRNLLRDTGVFYPLNCHTIGKLAP
jgi:hypothetical protein